MSKDIDIELAADKLKQLWEMHKEFMLQLRNHQKQEENPVGSLRVDGDKLSITSLGIFLDVKYRPVIVDKIKLFEYVVFTVHEGEQIIVFKFYLLKDGTLIRDAQSRSKLTDFNNENINKDLVYEVAKNCLNHLFLGLKIPKSLMRMIVLKVKGHEPCKYSILGPSSWITLAD